MRKKKNAMTAIGLLVGLSILALVSCDIEDAYDKGGDCPSKSPYWCSSAKVCCAYKYHDGHGTCHSSMEGCRRGGYQCEICHIDD